jgi:hypothetical protein
MTRRIVLLFGIGSSARHQPAGLRFFLQVGDDDGALLAEAVLYRDSSSSTVAADAPALTLLRSTAWVPGRSSLDADTTLEPGGFAALLAELGYMRKEMTLRPPRQCTEMPCARDRFPRSMSSRMLFRAARASRRHPWITAPGR